MQFQASSSVKAHLIRSLVRDGEIVGLFAWAAANGLAYYHLLHIARRLERDGVITITRDDTRQGKPLILKVRHEWTIQKRSPACSVHGSASGPYLQYSLPLRWPCGSTAPEGSTAS